MLDADAQLATVLSPEVMPFIDFIPDAMKAELLADDGNFLRRYQMTSDLAARFAADMRHLASPDAMRRVLRPTAFFRTRMQPVAGAIGHVACDKWPRYGYYPYVPVNFSLDDHARVSATLIVAVHGSSRNAIAQRDYFKGFAEANNCFVLAPLFPIDFSIEVPDEEYKYVIGSKERYDSILFDMITEFGALCNVEFDCILLCGFSGGGQFAHRIMYLHPERFTAVSVGAPGSITLLDTAYPWWVGVGDMETVAGRPIDYEALRALPVQLVCGRDDDLPFEIYSLDELGMTAEAYANYGRDRVTRMRRLCADYTAVGMNVQMELVDDAKHSPDALISRIENFFRPYVKQPEPAALY